VDVPASLTPAAAEHKARGTELSAYQEVWSFIRRRVPDPGEAEDILQDVFHDFVRAYRLPEPIEQAAAWLFRVARNRIIDRLRKSRTMPRTAWMHAAHAGCA
jgi:RNA polymerase sigma factor (sigma-70 family)